METYTDLEIKVYNSLINFCFDSCEADINDLTSETGLTKNTVKGVIGSLVKKQRVVVGEETRDGKKFMTINPIVKTMEILSFAQDDYTYKEIKNFLI